MLNLCCLYIHYREFKITDILLSGPRRLSFQAYVVARGGQDEKKVHVFHVSPLCVHVSMCVCIHVCCKHIRQRSLHDNRRFVQLSLQLTPSLSEQKRL